MLASGVTADDLPDEPGFDGPLVIRELRLIFSNSPMSVRRALRSTLGGLAGLELTADECATVELVLAEVLNNVVEHAYAGNRRGMIEFRVRHDERGLDCRVMDDGAPMPDGQLPKGRDDWCLTRRDTLPEGGFGWFLIRSLAEDLGYTYADGRNCLAFRLPVGRAYRPS